MKKVTFNLYMEDEEGKFNLARIDGLNDNRNSVKVKIGMKMRVKSLYL